MKSTDTIENTEDVIDSRDIIARIEHLESELESIFEEADTDASDFAEWLKCDDSDEANELKALRALASECEGYSDWAYGEQLIRDSYFREYAEQLADDIGAVPKELSWPCNHIDWEAAANALKQDYTLVSFGGVDYWIRS